MSRSTLLRIFSAALLLCCTISKAYPEDLHPDYYVVENEARLPILTPSLEGLQILKLKLKNNLEAFIISDPGTDKSAAAMAVNMGSWSDPEEYPGMAHFLEHMLFLGTEKYPKESEFQRFIDNHGGAENAYTSSDRTVYSFSINNSAFPEALDRFAQFFIAPLFNPSGVQREAHAIDQEYAKNLESDNWRLLFVRKALENPAHPDSRFNIGDLTTISKISPERLRQWYETHYSANLMHLIIYSNLPVDTLKQMVSDDFGPAPDRHIAPINVTVPLISPEYCNSLVYVTPFKDIRRLVLFWVMPAKYKYDADIVAYGLGDESRKSLLVTLKKEGLAEELSTGVTRYGNDLVFSLDISLTDKGVKNLQPVILRTFETIRLLNQKGIPEIFFNEIQSMAQLKYQYQSRQDPFDVVSDYADALVDENLDTFPEKTLIPPSFSPKGIAAVIQYLQSSPCQYYVVADPKLTGVPGEHKEPWLGAEYTVRPLPKSIKDAIASLKLSGQIELPPANPFVPKHLDLAPISASAVQQIAVKNIPLPQELLNNENGQFYYAPDTIYKVPEVVYSFRIHTPAVTPGNASQAVLLELFIKGIKQALTSQSYQASIANLTYNLDTLETGLSLSVQGYSEKSPVFLIDILDALTSLNLSDSEFGQIKQTLMSDYENAALAGPIKQAQDVMKAILYKNHIPSTEKAIALKTIGREDLTAFSKTLFDSTYVQGMLCGNLDETQAAVIIKQVNSAISNKPFPKNQIKKQEVIFLPDTQGPFIVTKKISPQGNAALLGIENSCYSYKAHAALSILSKGMEEPFFSELRTKQQTGYIVGSFGQEIQKALFNFYAVQSNTYDSRDLLSRFDLMIENFLRNLSTKSIPPERFEILQKTVAIELAQPPKNLKEMAQTLDILAFDYNSHFNRYQERLQGINELTYSEFTDFATDFLDKNNRRRIAVLMQGQQPENAVQYTSYKSVIPVKKLSQFFTRDDYPACGAAEHGAPHP